MTTARGACLVVGVGDGVGGAIARAFSAEGFEVCMTRRPRHLDQLEALAGQIRAEGGKARGPEAPAPRPVTEQAVRGAMERSVRWAQRARAHGAS